MHSPTNIKVPVLLRRTQIQHGLDLRGERDLLVDTWATAWSAIPSYCFALGTPSSRLQ